MKDPTGAAFQAAIKGPKLPQEEQQLRCPRCESTNTKFCYYNNYNLSQPRHFCKDCRRYWTKGGALRNIPIGGGTRKNSKRTASASSSSAKRSADALSSHAAAVTPVSVQFTKMEDIPSLYDPDRQLLDFTGSFSSLLTSHGNFGGLLDTFHAGLGTLPGTMGNNTSLDLHSPGDVGGVPPAVEAQPAALGDNLMGFPADSSCWSGSSGWSDLSIYTPGSNFQ